MVMFNVFYIIIMVNGEVIEGVIDVEGVIQLLQKDVMNIVKVDMKYMKLFVFVVVGIVVVVGVVVVVGKFLSGFDVEVGCVFSEGEISLVKGVFGDFIDYFMVCLCDEDYVFWQGKDYVMVLNGYIYFGEELCGVVDWNLESLQCQGLFIYEMIYVWQYQYGVNVFLVGVYQ